jgi:hypothetical protein
MKYKTDIWVYNKIILKLTFTRNVNIERINIITDVHGHEKIC